MRFDHLSTRIYKGVSEGSERKVTILMHFVAAKRSCYQSFMLFFFISY